jgi:hypothetical protein
MCAHALLGRVFFILPQRKMDRILHAVLPIGGQVSMFHPGYQLVVGEMGKPNCPSRER